MLPQPSGGFSNQLRTSDHLQAAQSCMLSMASQAPAQVPPPQMASPGNPIGPSAPLRFLARFPGQSTGPQPRQPSPAQHLLQKLPGRHPLGRPLGLSQWTPPLLQRTGLQPRACQGGLPLTKLQQLGPREMLQVLHHFLMHDQCLWTCLITLLKLQYAQGEHPSLSSTAAI